MATTIAELQAKVTADTSDADKNLKGFHKNLDETKDHAEGAGSGVLGFVKHIGGIAAGIGVADLASRGFDLVRDSAGEMMQAAMDSNKGIAQTAAVLASTHGVSGQTAQSVSDLADHFKNLDGIDDDVVRSAENMLLTFTNIKGDVFPQATQAALDMSTALGTDASQSSIMLGKALNDPINGVSALQRVGVTFSEKQKEMIAQAMKHGDVAKAQGIILKELGTEFGGSAKAAGDAQGPMGKLNLLWGDMQKQIGNDLLPVMQQLATGALPVLSAIMAGLPGVIAAVGAAFASLQPPMQFISVNGDMIKTVLLGIGLGIAAVTAPILIGLVPAFIAWAVAAGAAAVATILAALPIIAVIAGIALLVVGIKLLIDHWSQVTAFLQGVWSNVVAGVSVGLRVMGQWFSDLGTKVHDFAISAIAHIAEFVLGAIKFFQDLPGKIWGIVSSFVVGLVTRFVEMELRGLSIIGSFLLGVITFFAGLPGRVFGFIASLVSGLVSRFIDMELRGLAIIGQMISGLIDRIRGGVGGALSAMGAIKDAIIGVLTGLPGRLVGLVSDAIGSMIGAIRGAAGRVAGAFGSLFSGIHLPGFASGTDYAPGGLAMVGEHGPEVVALPRGSRVYPSGTGPSVGGGGGGGGDTYYITVNGSGDPMATARAVVQEAQWRALTAGG